MPHRPPPIGFAAKQNERMINRLQSNVRRGIYVPESEYNKAIDAVGIEGLPPEMQKYYERLRNGDVLKRAGRNHWNPIVMRALEVMYWYYMNLLIRMGEKRMKYGWPHIRGKAEWWKGGLKMRALRMVHRRFFTKEHGWTLMSFKTFQSYFYEYQKDPKAFEDRAVRKFRYRSN